MYPSGYSKSPNSPMVTHVLEYMMYDYQRVSKKAQKVKQEA